MLEKLRALTAEYDELLQKLQEPEVLNDHKSVAKLQKRLSDLEPLRTMLQEYDAALLAIKSADELKNDPELYLLAAEEAEAARKKIPELEERMKSFLIPRDPDDDKSVIIEVRAGAGGDEASLFASELMRMYLRFAELNGWKAEMMNVSDSETGGIKEASCKIEGTGFCATKLLFLSKGGCVIVPHSKYRSVAITLEGTIPDAMAVVAVIFETGFVTSVLCVPCDG
jgi:peptide chain release factor 1